MCAMNVTINTIVDDDTSRILGDEYSVTEGDILKSQFMITNLNKLFYFIN